MRLAPAALLLCFAMLTSSPGGAVQREPGNSGAEIVPASLAFSEGDDAALAAADEGWRSFEARHGNWSVMWNRRTASPHRAFGPAIELAGFSNDAASVESAVRGFIASEPGLFGANPDLELVSAVRARELWYVRFRERVGGVPVLFADWEFRVGVNGRLALFGADAMRGVPSSGLDAPRIAASVARAAATFGVDFDPATDAAEGGETLALLPVATENGFELRPVLEVEVATANPTGRWVALVDAATADVRVRFNRVRHAIQGTVLGDVHFDLPTDVPTSHAFAHQFVTVGGFTPITDLAGFYSATTGGLSNISAQLRGSFVNVNRQNGADASQATSATDPAVVNLDWNAGNSQDSERDAFFSVNRVHDYIKGIDPAMTALDYEMPCAVNIAATCNAFWDGTGVNFYLAGGGCPNTASMPDVVFHEYGHGINDRLYQALGEPFGMINGALHEGTSDINSAMVLDIPDVGRGFFGVGTVLRSIDNANHWPEDDGEGHFAGLIVGGSMWDLRQAIGLATTRDLAHFCRYGTPDDTDNGIAMHEYFVEVLVADDDDADLSNGTPNFAAIVAAFNAHGIGTGFFIQIAHTALTDTPDHGPYAVIANIQYTGPVGSLAAGSPTLHYSLNNGPFQTAAMNPTGNPYEFVASVPPMFAGLVHYYLTADDTFGASFAEPYGAPVKGDHLFLAGPFSTVFLTDMETNPGWTVGGPDDNANTGVWLRADPVGSDSNGEPSQPENDHTTAPGVQCWITGNAAAGAGAGTNDVDNGQTTVTTPAFSATGMTSPLIEYWFWYRNDLGSAPGEDTLKVQISNDGGTSWTTVFHEMSSLGEWRRALFFVGDYVTPTANMKLRFRAGDFTSGSLVEAGVDDLRLLAVPGTTDAPASPALSSELSLAAGPNPFSGALAIRWSLPVSAPASLDVYDVGGRLVRTIERGTLEAGARVSSWNGRDAAGRELRAGTYWLRLRAGERAVSRAVTLAH